MISFIMLSLGSIIAFCPGNNQISLNGMVSRKNPPHPPSTFTRSKQNNLNIEQLCQQKLF